MNAQQIIQRFNYENFHGNGENDDCRLVKLMRENGLNDEEIAGAISTMDDTCSACWDAKPDCQCWNDE